MGRETVNDFQDNLRTTIRRAAGLTFATLVLWVLLLIPAWSLAGVPGLEGLSYAAVLCLVPGWLTIWMSRHVGAPSQLTALLVLAGTAFRLLFVLCGTLLVRATRSQLGFREFLVWLIVFYLVTLLVETLLILKPATATGEIPGGVAASSEPR